MALNSTLLELEFGNFALILVLKSRPLFGTNEGISITKSEGVEVEIVIWVYRVIEGRQGGVFLNSMLKGTNSTNRHSIVAHCSIATGESSSFKILHEGVVRKSYFKWTKRSYVRSKRFSL